MARTGRKAFIPFLTAGDPDLDTTFQIVLAMAEAGADVIELGVPFSDPIADGPVIQRATDRALKGDVSMARILDMVERIREQSDVPLLLFSYYNPLLRFGLDRLTARAADAGVDGILASDLTVEESGPFVAASKKAGLNTVFLVAPTSSPDRISKIVNASTGFLYAVSRTGVTGAQTELPAELVEFIGRLRGHTGNPIAVGFGISTPEHVQAVWSEADGAVVGSAIVKTIEEAVEAGHSGKDIAARVGQFVAWLRGTGRVVE
jgi:tryptophan synthase alpha chain